MLIPDQIHKDQPLVNSDKTMDCHEFQLFDLNIADYLPKGIGWHQREELLFKNSFLPLGNEDAEYADSQRGIVVLAFGRKQTGESIAVRIHGFRPVLYFAKNDYKSKGDLIECLEIAGLMGAVRISQQNMWHTYDFEPDPETLERAKFQYWEVRFNSLKSFNKIARFSEEECDDNVHVASALRNLLRTSHESFIDHTTRFWTDANIRPGWVSARGETVDVKVTTCQIELECDITDLQQVKRVGMAPIRFGHFDIETLGLDCMNDKICTIGFTIETYGVDKMEEFAIQVGEVSPNNDDKIIISVVSEEAALLAFRDFIIEHDLDALVTYNGSNFDENFICERIKLLSNSSNTVENAICCSRFIFKKCYKKMIPLASAAMGDNKLNIINTPGIMHFDWYIKFKLEDKEDSYSLNHFAQKYVGDQKDDMPYWQIPEHANGTPEQRRKLALYCVQDCTLLGKLARKRFIYEALFQTSDVCLILPEWVYFRGQQVRYYAQKLFEARHNMRDLNGQHHMALLNEPILGLDGNRSSQFEGAIVLEPIVGYYVQEPIAVLDFASLYPSAIIDENLSPDTLIRKQEHRSIPGVKHHIITNTLGFIWKVIDVRETHHDTALQNDELCRLLRNGKLEYTKDELKEIFEGHATSVCKEGICEKQNGWSQSQLKINHYVDVDGVVYAPKSIEYYFATHIIGIVPQITENLLKARKQTKREMAKLEDYLTDNPNISDDEKKSIKSKIACLDGKQKAEKVAANSIYGAQGAFGSSKRYCKAVAECTTNEARRMLLEVKEYTEQNYDVDIVYGDTDSIFVKYKGVMDMQQVCKYSLEVESGINTLYKQRGNRKKGIEYEKAYHPFLLLQKKRYAGVQYEPNKYNEMIKKKMDCKGIEVARRDFCVFARHVCQDVLNSIMYDQDVTKILATLDRNMQNMMNEQIPYDDFKLSKRLASSYKVEGDQPHFVVNMKRKERLPGSEYKSGERVYYVIKSGNPDAKVATIAECFYYAMENKVKLNYEWYLGHQMSEPIMRLFNPIKGIPMDLFDRYKGELKRKRMGITSLSQFGTQISSTSSSTSAADPVVSIPKRRKKGEVPKGMTSLGSFMKPKK